MTARATTGAHVVSTRKANFSRETLSRSDSGRKVLPTIRAWEQSSKNAQKPKSRASNWPCSRVFARRPSRSVRPESPPLAARTENSEPKKSITVSVVMCRAPVPAVAVDSTRTNESIVCTKAWNRFP